MKHLKLEEAPRLEPVNGAHMALIGDGERMTLIRMEFHGMGTLTSGGESIEVEPGVTWAIPADEPHRFEADKSCVVVIYEAFSPPREDYRAMARPT